MSATTSRVTSLILRAQTGTGVNHSRQEKLGRGFGINVDEWTGRVETSKKEIPGSRHSMHGYIRTCSSLRRESLCAMGERGETGRGKGERERWVLKICGCRSGRLVLPTAKAKSVPDQRVSGRTFLGSLGSRKSKKGMGIFPGCLSKIN